MPKQTKQIYDNKTALIKSKSLFLRGDLLVYSALIFCILLLFVFFVLPTKNSKSDGFLVSHNNQTVFTFTFSKDNPLEISDNFLDLTKVNRQENGYEITVYLENKSSYNVIFIDVNNLTAKVIDANCSERKDCFHSPAIKNNGTIYCSPHDLLITPLSLNNDTPIAG